MKCRLRARQALIRYFQWVALRTFPVEFLQPTIIRPFTTRDVTCIYSSPGLRYTVEVFICKGLSVSTHVLVHNHD